MLYNNKNVLIGLALTIPTIYIPYILISKIMKIHSEEIKTKDLNKYIEKSLKNYKAKNE